MNNFLKFLIKNKNLRLLEFAEARKILANVNQKY